MPRQARLLLPDVAAHIVQRGNNRVRCFVRDGDYMLYLYWLRELAREHGCAVHAYCLMTNHVHILLTPASADACSLLMKELGQRYAQHFNRNYGRSGTLWEGRYRSCVAESGPYVIACYRYIELNPVRAGLTADPGAYPWSSHRANAGVAERDWLTPHPEFLALGHNALSRQTAYGGLFEETLGAKVIDRIRKATKGGYPLGSAAFGQRIAQEFGRRATAGRPGRPARALA
jgi:putative transposase